jgi:hypothetical protein
VSGCSASESQSLPAAEFALRYESSPLATRQEFEGRELSVHGAVLYGPTPRDESQTEGYVILGGGDPQERQIKCWFSEKEAERFVNIHSGQNIGVRGIFSGEAGAEIRFCRLVSVENQEQTPESVANKYF